MTAVMKVENLRKEFGGLVAVDNISFEVNEGEFIGLIGPNGCGKSTTFNCISGLLNQTSGKIEVFGTDVSKMRPDEIQSLGVTRTFQHTRLWREMSVIENLLVPPRDQFRPSLTVSEFRKALSYGICGLLALLTALLAQSMLVEYLAYLTTITAFGMVAWWSDPQRHVWNYLIQVRNNPPEIERLSKVYSTLDQLEVPHMAPNLANELSGGQSKLVDIGRSMMGDPRLLLLDEPVAGVAGPLAMKIFANLRKIVDDTGVSVLIIEHNMDFILRQGVDRIVVMNEGELLMVGTPDEVRSNKAVIEAYLGSGGDTREDSE